MVDDDARLGDMIADYLLPFGYAVCVVGCPSRGLSALAKQEFAAAIFDVMLPEMDGFELCKRVRQDYPRLPIIILTARGDVLDRVVGLEIGADDYLSKPFEPRELAARLAALLRRTARLPDADVLHFDGMQINIAARRLWLFVDGAEEEIILTAAEFRVLAELVRWRPTVLERDFLIEKIRGFERDIFDRSIDITVSRLRTKLRDSPSHPRYIQTARGLGYAFIAPTLSA